MPQGRLKDSPLQVIKFVFACALHRTVLATPEVSISDETLRVGQEFTILYKQCFNQQVHLSRFAIALVFTEELRQLEGDGDHVEPVERIVER